MVKFACHKRKKDGRNCTRTFASERSLRDHQRACHDQLNHDATSSSRYPKLASDELPQTSSAAMIQQLPQSVNQPVGFSLCNDGLAGASSQGQPLRCPLMSHVRENTQCPWECLSKMSLRQHTVLDHNTMISKRGRPIPLTGAKLQLAIATIYNRLLKHAKLEEKMEKRKVMKRAKKTARSRNNATNCESSESCVDKTLQQQSKKVFYSSQKKYSTAKSTGYQSQAYSCEKDVCGIQRFSSRQLQSKLPGHAEESNCKSEPSIDVNAKFNCRRPDENIEQSDKNEKIGESRCDTNEQIVEAFDLQASGDQEECFIVIDDVDDGVENNEENKLSEAKQQQDLSLMKLHSNHTETSNGIVEILDDYERMLHEESSSMHSRLKMGELSGSYTGDEFGYSKPTDCDQQNKWYKMAGYCPDDTSDEPNWKRKRKRKNSRPDIRDGERNKRQRSVSVSDDVSGCLGSSQSSTSISGHKRYSRAEQRTPEIQELLRRREKQIAYGKNTACYENYLRAVPRNTRTLVHPSTPDRMINYSRRGWDMLVKIWRKQLHVWDPEQGCQS